MIIHIFDFILFSNKIKKEIRDIFQHICPYSMANLKSHILIQFN